MSGAEVNPIRSPLKFILFAIFFPSLVAGPIKRYQQFLPELERAVASRVSSEDFGEGLRRIALGFGKKILIADWLTVYIDRTQGHFAELTLPLRWLFTVALGLRILFDFSGYCDIAIGSARLLGIRLPENFDWPYLAGNLQEFWQRWHISLSSWIRDYVYIPLGGGHHGPVRRIVNALFAFALCGLWHGAAWNFVVWGLFHGVGLSLSHVYKKVPVLGPFLARGFEREPLSGWVFTSVYVGVGWYFFFYPLGNAIRMIRLLFGAA